MFPAVKFLFCILVLMLIVGCGNSNESIEPPPLLISDLEQYGHEVAAATEGAVIFDSAYQTTKSPTNAFQLLFKTDINALKSKPGAEPGNAAYYANVGQTKAWSIRFCTDELKSIMARHDIDLVTGKLTDLNGELQSMAIC